MTQWTVFRRAGTVLFLVLLSHVMLLGQNVSSGAMDFWVPFPSSIVDNMSVYISTGSQAATITITIKNGSGVDTKEYKVAAHASLVSPVMPVSLMLDIAERTYNKIVHIHSDVPVSAYAHYYGPERAGATQLLPVHAWGYRYQAMDVPADYAGYVCVAAAEDDTKVEIVPSITTAGGRAAGTPYTVALQKGEVYQMKATSVYPTDEMEITGTTVKSLPDAKGICHPVGVYAGAYSMYIHTSFDAWASGSSDFEIKQMPPETSWGKQFLTAPFSATNDMKTVNPSIFRIMVKDPATIVKWNGTSLTGLHKNSYYEFVSKEAGYIESDQGVMVAQYMLSRSEKAFPVSGLGDGEMVILSPLHAAARSADCYLSKYYQVSTNLITLIVPTPGLPSLYIDGTKSFDYTYLHPNKPGYTVVIKKWPASGKHCSVSCDSSFTALAYGMHNYESFVVDITKVPVPLAQVLMKDNNTAVLNDHICPDKTFRFVFRTEYIPQVIEWHLKDIAGLSPVHDNIVINNPVPDSVGTIDGRPYNVYSVPGSFKWNGSGKYTLAVTLITPAIENCTHTRTFTSLLTGNTFPVADFSFTQRGCSPFDTKFTAGAAGDTSTLVAWSWNFGSQQASTATAAYQYPTPGEKSVYLQVTAANGCMADTVKKINLVQGVEPVAVFRLPATVCMPYGGARFLNETSYNGNAGPLTYQWFFEDAHTSTEKDPVHYYAKAGTYQVKLIATATDGCSDTTLTQALSSFVERPKAGFEVPATGSCVAQTEQFTDQSVAAPGSTITQWNWELGAEGKTSDQQHPSVTYNRPGDYPISLFVTSKEGCISDTAGHIFSVHDFPKVEAGPDQVILRGSGVQLQGRVDAARGVNIQWTPAVYLDAANTVTPNANPPADQLFYLTATTGVCKAYDSVLVKVVVNVVIPNAFTPNGDGTHDRWLIEGLDVFPAADVKVFNRWGRMVFQSKVNNLPWDGTWQSKALPSGTYYYVIRLGEGKPVHTGPVTILR